MSETSVERVRELYEALARSDIEQYLEGLRDDVVFHVGGVSQIAGDYRGKEAVVALGLKVLEETGGTFRTDLRDAIGTGSHVVTLHHWTAQRREKSIAMDNLNVYRLDEDGYVVERWEFIEDQARHDAFWD